MRIVKCYDCGKKYDFDADDFCPGCGAFTPPPRRARIDMDGNVVRVDGLNERNHAGSFVHAELHEENRARKGTPMQKPKVSAPVKRLPQQRRKSGLNVGLDLLEGAAKMVFDILDS